MIRFAVVICCVLSLLNASTAKSLVKVPRPYPGAGRIVGGQEIDIKDANYQITLLYYSSLMCGGSIINENVVVTAAHCTDGTSPSELSIRAGSSQHSEGGQVISVKTIIQNENYDDFNADYDCSLLILSSPISFGPTAGPIALPSQDQNVPDGSEALTSGWGTTSENGNIASNLRQVKIFIVNQSTCDSAYGGGVTDRMICAGVPEGGKDACQGDSGGPLVVDNTLVGITSWGYGCARAGYPGVWGRVPAMADWIQQNMRNHA